MGKFKNLLHTLSLAPATEPIKAAIEKYIPKQDIDRFTSAPPLQTEDKAKSKSLYELFPNSRRTIELYEGAHNADQLKVLSFVAKTLVSTGEFEPGKCKVKLIAEKGSRTLYLDDSNRHDDRLGIYLVRGRHGTVPIDFAFIREKSYENIAQKGLEFHGASALQGLPAPETGLRQVYKILEGLLNDPKIQSRKKEQLSSLRDHIFAEISGQDAFLEEICGHDVQKMKAMNDLLDKIGQNSKEIIELNKKLSESLASGRKHNCISDIISAAKSWPLDRSTAECLFDLAPAKTQEQMGKWAKEYLVGNDQPAINAKSQNGKAKKIEPMVKIIGSEYLDNDTAPSTISRMQHQVLFIHSKIPATKEGALLEKIRGDIAKSHFGDEGHATLDSLITQLTKVIYGVERRFDKIRDEGKGYSPREWFTSLAQIGENRKKMLSLLESMENIVDSLDHEPHHKSHMRGLLEHMAFNLCRTSKSEADSWAEFEKIVKPARAEMLANSMKSSFKSLQGKDPCDKACAQCSDFITLAQREAKIYKDLGIKGMEENEDEKKGGKAKEKDPRQKMKDRKAELDAKIFRCITELAKIEGLRPISDILRSDYELIKTHSSYKRGDTLSPAPINHLSRLRIAQWYLDHGMSSPVLSKKVGDYLEDVASLYSLLSEDKATFETMIKLSKESRFASTRAFDIVGDPEMLSESKNTNPKIDVKYSIFKKEGVNFISLKFGGKDYELELGESMPHDSGGSEEENWAKAAVQSIYGKKMPLDSVVPGYSNDMAPKDFFKSLYQTAIKDQPFRAKVDAKFKTMDMNTSHALSTVVDSGKTYGCVANFGGVVIESMPEILGTRHINPFKAHVKASYDDFDADEMEAQQFIQSQIARIAVSKLAVHKADLALQYIFSILARQEKSLIDPGLPQD